MKELIALLDGREVGIVRQDRNRLTFTYLDSWRTAPGAYPLSLSMPLAAAEHSHAAIEPFLWGLLPDNEFVLARWAQRFQVSPRNPFALLAHVGEDCAGAVQFVTRDRVADVTGAAVSEVDWIDEAQVAARLRALRDDASAWRQPGDAGQFSLAGAQPKTALLFDGARWGVPSGRAPTTHILKPPINGFDGHAENEHICMALARALGMPAARSEVRRFGDETAIVVERYDRVYESGVIRRLHQEDMCQALSVHPSHKYQNDGGPGPKEIISLLRETVTGLSDKIKSVSFNAVSIVYRMADNDIQTFIDALIFNWLIGGTDAHAKNYSVLIGAGGMVRLAPLYDLASILPYDDIDPRKAKLAMKIGDEYRLHHIGLSEWRKLAANIKVDADAVVDSARAMAARLPDALSDEIVQARADGLTHPLIDRLQEKLSARAEKVASV
ncbi:MAG: type II toxin-antitoxin system HipA family toxin [Parvularculaceae bacterium]|nr:type II toxin-antitoxin system HipA family toxin [Parvularculaceae bacterium]